jgi:hypothetical protein
MIGKRDHEFHRRRGVVAARELADMKAKTRTSGLLDQPQGVDRPCDRVEGVRDLDPLHVVVLGRGAGAVLHHGLAACGRLEADGEDEDVLRVCRVADGAQVVVGLRPACIKLITVAADPVVEERVPGLDGRDVEVALRDVAAGVVGPEVGQDSARDSSAVAVGLIAPVAGPFIGLTVGDPEILDHHRATRHGRNSGRRRHGRRSGKSRSCRAGGCRTGWCSHRPSSAR